MNPTPIQKRRKKALGIFVATKFCSSLVAYMFQGTKNGHCLLACACNMNPMNLHLSKCDGGLSS